MNKPKLAKKKDCTGCMSCVDICSKKSLKGLLAKDGHLYVEWTKENCVECGLCSKICPIVNGYNYEAKNRQSQPYAAWANSDELRLRSASGGVFAALAYYVISNGGYVVGAIMDNLVVQHVLINRVENIGALQGSKYQQGDLTGIYREVREQLKHGNLVLFSGTGCQVGGLYSFLGKLDKSSLITVDLICSGFPSILPLRKEVSCSREKVKLLSFRDKTNGWLNARQIVFQTTDDLEKKVVWEKSVVSSAFSKQLLHRDSCLSCRFCYANRKSDLTLGDFWGDVDYPEEHFKGLSIVVVHSDVGYKLLSESDVTFHLTTWRKFLPINFRMVYGSFSVVKYHPIHIWSSLYFNKCSYSSLLKKINSPWGGNFVKTVFYRFLLHFLFARPMRSMVEDAIKKNDK